MDEVNTYQQQESSQIQNESFTTSSMHYGEWKPTTSTFHSNPAYMMQENEDQQVYNVNQNDELPQSNIKYEEVQLHNTNGNGNDYGHYDIPEKKGFGKPNRMNRPNYALFNEPRPKYSFSKNFKILQDTTDRAHLPPAPLPPENNASSKGHYVSPPQIRPDDHVPITMPLTINSLSPDKGIHEIVLEKDDKGKLGLKVKNIKMGVYIMEVVPNSPASIAGILPGDRILQINNIKVDKFDDEKMSEFLKKLPVTPNRMVINKRPLEKIITVQKDEKGQMGLQLRSNKIHSVAKNSPADIVGLSTDYYLLEVNGTKLRGKTDNEIRNLLKEGDIITVTVMPYYLYEPLMKQIPIR